MVQQLKLKITRHLQKNAIDLNDVAIITAETRGIPIASQVAFDLNLLLCIIRKKGGYKMTSDDLYTESYSKGYDEIDVVELPRDKVHSLAGKKIIFLDDGLASGKSALACINLVEKKWAEDKVPAKVIMVLSILKHDYVKLHPKLSECTTVKTLFDCHGGPSIRTEQPASVGEMATP